MRGYESKCTMWGIVLGALLAAVLSAVPRVAYAAPKDPYLRGKVTDLTGTITMYLSSNLSYKKSECSYSCNPKKLSALSSSNTDAVFPVAKYSSTSLNLYALNAGTSRVKFTYAGKKYGVKVVVKKFENTVSKFTIGSTDLTSKLKKASYCGAKVSKFKNKKVTVKPAVGWKVVGVYAEKYKPSGVVYTVVKNGSKLPNMSLDQLCLLMQNEKTKGYVVVQVYSES